MASVHQLLPTFRDGDATSQAALDFQRALEDHGRSGRVFSLDAAFDERVRPASELRPQPDDWVLYHHGIASELAGRLLRLPCRRAVVFHNISPVGHYEGTNLAYALRSGRAQLAGMAPFVDLGIGVSEFNAEELREAGYATTAVVPLAIEPERFAREHASLALSGELGLVTPTLLCVGRVVAHKRVEDVLELHQEVVRLRPGARLLLVGGYDEGTAHFRALSSRARDIPGVRFLGRVSHEALVASYRAASVFVSMSEHEGFGVPLIEAMAAEVPVMAYAAAAVPETLGGAGIAFDAKDFPLLAELAVELSESAALRKRVLAGQARRLRQLSLAEQGKRLAQALAQSERQSQRRVG